MTPVMLTAATPSVFAEAIEKVLSAPDAPDTTHEIAAAVELVLTEDGTLDAYLRDALPRLLSRDVQAWMGSLRKSAKAASRRSVFTEAATGEPGAPTPISGLWLPVRYRLPDGAWRPLGTLTADELLGVASDYQKRAEELQGEAIWIRAIARAIPEGKTVSEVFSESQLRSLRSATVS